VWQVLVVFVENFFGHAVIAAKVAPIGHADAQVAQRAPPRVSQQAIGAQLRAGRKSRWGQGKRAGALVYQRNNPGRVAFGHGSIFEKLEQVKRIVRRQLPGKHRL
jgi:hypothetical protein